jgi:preprotein translocase subunit SecF
MELFNPNATVDFMKQRKWATLVSCALFIVCISLVAVKGLNLGLDFTGGHQIQLEFPETVNFDKIRNQLAANGFTRAMVQAYGSSQNVLIKMPPHEDVAPKELKKRVSEALPRASITQSQYIGPQVGKRLMTNGILAILVSLLGTMLYVAMRFEYRFAVSAMVAMIHDPIVVLGVFAITRTQFDLVALAAVLTVIGYSLNDTIVVYDRIRENFRKLRKATPEEVTNRSINHTLSRTIMTSGLTLIVVVALLIFGGEALRGFALAMTVGIIVGTYSSIYVAGALALALGLDRRSLLPAEKKEVDESP